MSEAQTSKRGASAPPELQQNKASQPGCKKRKRRASAQPALRQNNASPPKTQFVPAFWCDLSQIYFSRNALKELDRRNIQETLSLPGGRLTCRVFDEREKSSQLHKAPAEYLRHCGTSDLKNIKQFARGGGPDLSDLRGLPIPSDFYENPSELTQSSAHTQRPTQIPTLSHRYFTMNRRPRQTTPYDRNFEQHLIDHGVYPDLYDYPDGRCPSRPANWEEIRDRLGKPRTSQISDDDFNKFRRAVVFAKKEVQVISLVIPLIQGTIVDAKCTSGGIPFRNLDALTNGRIVPANPDIFYGARPEQLLRQVRDELGGHIIPTTEDSLPVAPNFFLAVKGLDGSSAVASRQAMYDGALGARGMRSLQSYKQEEPVFVNTTATITSTYHDGQLRMYTIHPSQPTSSESRTEYITHQLGAWALTGDIDTFRRGVTAYRNARDWAKEQRDYAIESANEKAKEHLAATLDIDTSNDP